MLRSFGREKKLLNNRYNPFKNNFSLIKDYDYFQLRECEEPYETTKKHLIVWDKEQELPLEMQHSIKRRQLENILNKYLEKGYTVIVNSKDKRSVLKYKHYHLIKR